MKKLTREHHSYDLTIHSDGTIESYDRYVLRGNHHMLIRGRILKPSVDRKGYLSIATEGKRLSVHRLVAEMFLPNPERKPQVNHIDGDKSNNSVDNLEWCNNSENNLHRFRLKANKRGVTKNGKGFLAKIKLNGSTLCFGTYKTKEEAYEAFFFGYTMLIGEYPW
jgi:hypothetical protein